MTDASSPSYIIRGGAAGRDRRLAPGGTMIVEDIDYSGQVDSTVAELVAFAERDDSILGMPRIVQAWGRRPGTSGTA